MPWKMTKLLAQGVAACTLWICGPPLPLSAMPQAPQSAQTDVGSKPRTSKKSEASTSAQTVEKQTKAPAPVKNASEADIQSAKASGKVWVNTQSGVYHKGGKWFGATKQGKFMTEQEATQAGYRQAKNEK